MTDLAISLGRPPALAAWHRIPAYATLSIAAVLYTFVVGKDLNWDALNYHLYAGFSALEDRFDLDFFAAGATSYFNPYAHAPFYLLVAAGAPAALIGAWFAILHSISLWLVYELALALQEESAARRLTFAWLAALLAALNPVFLQELGSSFNDISTGSLVLGGWLLLVHYQRLGRRGLLLAGASLLGLASALKLSNVVPSMAALVLVPRKGQSWAGSLRCLAAFAACGALAFIVAHAPWAWKLWSQFRNPVFPLFNEWFRSDDFIVQPLRHERFLPLTWTEFLARPFRMAIPERMIHTEPRAPDTRYAVLVAILGVWLLLRWRGRIRRVSTTNARLVDAFAIAFGIAWTTWLLISGNSRYFVPMSGVAAVLIAVLLARFGSGRWVGYGMAAIVGVQVVQIVMGTQLRWMPQDWEGDWFRVRIPERFRSESYLYLSTNVQSASFLAPFVAKGSGFINVSGSYVLGDGRPGTVRAEGMIAARATQLRSLSPVQLVDAKGRPLPPRTEVLDGRVRRFGLAVDPTDCDYFELDGGLDLVTYGHAPPGGEAPKKVTYFQTCRLVARAAEDPEFRQEWRQANRVFDHVEDACPNLFHPRRTVAEKNVHWTRHYVLGSDLQLYIVDGIVKYMNPAMGGEALTIGRVEDWERVPQAMDCSRRQGDPFTLTPADAQSPAARRATAER